MFVLNPGLENHSDFFGEILDALVHSSNGDRTVIAAIA